MSAYTLPTIGQVVASLGEAARYTWWADHPEGLEVRLQVTLDGWFLHTGDPSFDTSHLGVWGASMLSSGGIDDLNECAEDLLAQVEDAIAEKAYHLTQLEDAIAQDEEETEGDQ